jgi:excisionase family DNA binding protein
LTTIPSRQQHPGNRPVSEGCSEPIPDTRVQSPDLTLLLKPTEVAAQLSVSRTWLYDAAKTGRIPSIRIGGEDGPLRFVSEDLERWIDDARAARHPAALTSLHGFQRLSDAVDRSLTVRQATSRTG